MALFEKGHAPVPGSGRPKGSGVALKTRIEACARFMETEGWLIAMEIARAKGREAVKALELLSHYGYGKPIESLDVTTGGHAIDFMSILSKAVEQNPVINTTAVPIHFLSRKT